jgi:hypothetical protein
MNLEKFTLELHSVLLSSLLSENLLFLYKHVYGNIVFLQLCVWRFVCDIEERLSTGFGNSADQFVDLVAESNRKMD